MPDSGACPTGQSLCGGVCRAVATDALNCGSCGNICLGGIRAAPACAASRCTVRCDTGYADCDGMTATGCETNLAASNAHCGSCGNTCPTGQSCAVGVCRPSCTAGMTLCGATCVNPSSDSNHCGMCGAVCPSGQACSGGACRVSCTSVQTLCGGVCVNTQTDARNCGTCTNACPTGQACAAGVCSAVLMRYTQGAPPSTAGFIDACGAVGRVRVLTSVDDSAAASTLPFAFRFWGAPLAAGAAVNVASNGMLNLDGTVSSGYPIPTTLPATSTPNGVIAPHWVDLETTASGVCIATVGAAPDRHYVVEWAAVSYYISTNSMTFEAVLNESDNTIDFFYQTMTGVRTSVTTALENPTGTLAVGGCATTSCSDVSGTRIRFTPSP